MYRERAGRECAASSWYARHFGVFETKAVKDVAARGDGGGSGYL